MSRVVSIQGLRIEVAGRDVDIVDEINLEISAGEILGLVGESGSGKTTVGLSLLGHARRGVKLALGEVRINETNMLTLPERDLREARGKMVSYVPQDPSVALNPALRIGKQIIEVLEFHDFGGSSAARQARVREVMEEVRLPSTREFLRRYPHQLSGGQQQRVGLAMAFANRPAVIVLDEPTTGLDVSTQAHVLATIRRLASEHGVAALYVTHDLAVVANLAHRIAVMYAGRVVEEGPTAEVFANPAHPYTRYLMAAAPDMTGDHQMVGLGGRAPAPGRRPIGCFFAERCELASDICRESFPKPVSVGVGRVARCVTPMAIPDRTRAVPVAASSKPRESDTVLRLQGVVVSYTGKQVVHDIEFGLQPGECLALVGESGSGKTTLSRSIGGLHHEWTGVMTLDGQSLSGSSRDRTMKQRLAIQYVFQNPYGSLNPRRTVGASIARPLMIAGADEKTADLKVGEMLEKVSLTADYAARYPDQLSGGERQRAAIARGLAASPRVLICDEVTSALDVLVQAAIVELLAELRGDLGLAMLFVTHNLPLVRSIADRVAVMAEGRIEELGTATEVIETPKQEYTRRLLSDTPQIGRSTA